MFSLGKSKKCINTTINVVEDNNFKFFFYLENMVKLVLINA